MDSNNLLSMEDLEGVLDQLKDMPDTQQPPTEEELASQRRYDEIIKKHKAEQ